MLIKTVLASLLIVSFFLPLPVAAVYNTITWGPQTSLFFSGVAPGAGEAKGITVRVYENSYLDRYILDTGSLRVTMHPGSRLHLKSNDRKLFSADTVSVSTNCYPDYSTFDYETPEETVTFTITLSDDANCAAFSGDGDDSSGETQGQKIDLLRLDSPRSVADLSAGDMISFVVNNIMEVVTVENVGSNEATVSLSKLNRVFYLKRGVAQNIDVDADGYRDARLLLAEINNGLRLVFEPIAKVAINGVEPGDLLKIAGSPAVYYFGPDSRRYVFPNDKVFFSWYQDFDTVKTVTAAEMALLPIGGLVTYRPGYKLVKFLTSPDVYAVSQGGVLRKLRDEAMAAVLYGADWNKKIDDISDAFYSSYLLGAPLSADTDFEPMTALTLSPIVSVDKNL